MFFVIVLIIPCAYFIYRHRDKLLSSESREIHIQKFKNDSVYKSKFKTELSILAIVYFVIIYFRKAGEGALIIFLAIFLIFFFTNLIFPTLHYEDNLHCWNCNKKTKHFLTRVHPNLLIMILSAGTLALPFFIKLFTITKTICSKCNGHYSEKKPIKSI